jgi:hypothetical protein
MSNREWLQRKNMAKFTFKRQPLQKAEVSPSVTIKYRGKDVGFIVPSTGESVSYRAYLHVGTKESWKNVIVYWGCVEEKFIRQWLNNNINALLSEYTLHNLE